MLAGGQPEGLVILGIQDRRGQAGRFAAEDKDVAGAKLGFPDRASGEAGKVVAGSAVEGRDQGFPVGDESPAEMSPVVEAGPSEPFLVKAEATGLDDPEMGPDGDTGAADVSGVLGDLRLVQDHLRDRGGLRRLIPA